MCLIMTRSRYLAFQGAHSGDNHFVQAPPDIMEQPHFHEISPDATCGSWQTPTKGLQLQRAVPGKLFVLHGLQQLLLARRSNLTGAHGCLSTQAPDVSLNTLMATG